MTNSGFYCSRTSQISVVRFVFQLVNLQGAPRKNNTLGKIHYLSYCNIFFHRIYRLYRGGFRPHRQHISRGVTRRRIKRRQTFSFLPPLLLRLEGKKRGRAVQGWKRKVGEGRRVFKQKFTTTSFDSNVLLGL